MTSKVKSFEVISMTLGIAGTETSFLVPPGPRDIDRYFRGFGETPLHSVHIGIMSAEELAGVYIANGWEQTPSVNYCAKRGIPSARIALGELVQRAQDGEELLLGPHIVTHTRGEQRVALYGLSIWRPRHRR